MWCDYLETRACQISPTTVRRYIKARLSEEVSGRTINMELGELSRAIGKPWSLLWLKVRKLEEQQHIGQALSPEAERRLLTTAAGSKRWRMGQPSSPACYSPACEAASSLDYRGNRWTCAQD